LLRHLISGPILTRFVTGHDFSRAEQAQNQGRALAPAILNSSTDSVFAGAEAHTKEKAGICGMAEAMPCYKTSFLRSTAGASLIFIFRNIRRLFMQRARCLFLDEKGA
jgi:hypothetical protein